jgi:MFS transporter, ACS family, tartrate transporter
VSDASELELEERALGKVGRRLIPFLALLYFAAFIDRVNVGFAALQMNRDLGFSAYVYGLASGLFFVGYCIFEVPSNLALHRIGARRWISSLMIAWAVIAGATAWVRSAEQFYLLRFLLGAAEAGFFPGIVYYLTHWVPARRRARLVGAFMTAIPISTAIGGPLSGAILTLDGHLGLPGWQWLFLLETIPSLLLGALTLAILPDRPASARWLSPPEVDWIARALDADASAAGGARQRSVLQALLDPRVLLLSLCYFGTQIGLYGVILWVPQIFVDAGFAERTTGNLVVIPYACAAVAMVWWCRHSDRRGERTWHIVTAAVVAAAGLAASAYLHEWPLLRLAAISVSAVGTLSIVPIFWTLPTAILRGAAAAGAIGLINGLGNIGGFVGPFVIGWAKQLTGSFAVGLMVAAAGMLLTAVVALFIGDPAASARSRQAQ